MDGNFSEQKKEVPAPPAPEISIRTMESDIKGLERSGGEIIAPKTFLAPKDFKILAHARRVDPVVETSSIKRIFWFFTF